MIEFGRDAVCRYCRGKGSGRRTHAGPRPGSLLIEPATTCPACGGTGIVRSVGPVLPTEAESHRPGAAPSRGVRP